MISGEPIKVLSKCRNFLKYMNLGLKSELRIGRLKIPNVVSFVICSIPLVTFILLEFFKVLDVGFDGFQKNTAAFIVFLGCLRLQLIYIWLVNKNKLIIETVDFLQKVVDKSEFYHFH